MPSFDMELSNCPSPTYGRDFVFSPLYSLASFVSDELNLSVWGLSLDFVSCSLGLYFFFCVPKPSCLFFFSPFDSFFTEAELLYHVVLISAVDQSECAMCMHVYPLHLELPCFGICVCAPYS